MTNYKVPGNLFVIGRETNTPTPPAGAVALTDAASIETGVMAAARLGSGAGGGKFLRDDGTWAVPASGGISGSGSAGQVTFWNGAASVTGSNDLWWDATNKRLGIGTTSPAKPLHIKVDPSDATKFITAGGLDAYSRSLFQMTGYLSVIRMGASSTDGDPFDAVSDGIVVYNPTTNSMSRIKADRFGLTRCTDSGLYYFRADPTALYYRADPPGGAVHFYVDRATGNVGIGTGSPTSLLHVAGAAHITGKLTVDGAIDPTSISFTGVNTDIFADWADGRNVAVSAASHGRIRYNSNTQTFQTSVNTGAWADFPAGGGITGSGAAGQVTFWTGASVISGSYSMIWDDVNSRLGIGTGTPLAPLHVFAGAGWALFEDLYPNGGYTVICQELRARTNDAGLATGFGPSIRFTTKRSTDPLNDLAEIGAVYAGSASVGDIVFKNSNGGSAVEQMRLIAAGKLGIGTSDPKFRLDVVGGIAERAALPGPTSAPTDADLDNAQWTIWTDEGTNALTFRVKYSDGSLKTGTVALV